MPAVPLVQRKPSLLQGPTVSFSSEQKEMLVKGSPVLQSEPRKDDVATVVPGEVAGQTPVPSPAIGDQKTEVAASAPSRDVLPEAKALVGNEPKGDEVKKDLKEEAEQSIEALGKSTSPVIVSPRTDHGKILDDQIAGTPDSMSRAATPPPKEKRIESTRPTLRTLNITSEMIETLRRSESQALLSTTTEKSAAFPTLNQIRQYSRQPSISVSTNISRPSTPAASDRYGLMSQDVSRAGSPPPGGSVVGSAPARQKTKNQAKKERREKAKNATGTSEASNISTVPAQPPVNEVGPIVARQKKQKKTKNTATSADPEHPITRTEAVRPQAEDQKEVSKGKNAPQPRETNNDTPPKDSEKPSVATEDPPVSRPATPVPVMPESIPAPYTLRDFYTEASKLQSQHQGDDNIRNEQMRSEIQNLLASHVSPLQKLLSDMVASGDLAKDHPFFNPQSFTSASYKLPPDHRKGQAYLDGNNYSSSDVFGMIYLPRKEKNALRQGHAVSIADPVTVPTNNGADNERKEDILRRCLITPTGWVLRHLSRDESEKLLDLEERRQMYLEEFGELGRMDNLGALEDNDYINLEGGFEELDHFGNRHGVCWVVNQDISRGGRHLASNTNEDDYGLGEMPLDDDDLDGEEERYDDLNEEEDEIDEEELEGEDLVQRVVPEDEQYDDGEDNDLGTFANLTGDPSMSTALPPLPPSMMMNMNMGIPLSTGWNPSASNTYPERSTHAMYSGLNTPNAYGAGYTSTGYVMDEMLPPASELPIPRNPSSNVLPPIRHHANQPITRVNLRAMNEDDLAKRAKEKQKEMDTARKESERLEKLMTKKAKDLGRWRESIFRGVAVGGS